MVFKVLIHSIGRKIIKEDIKIRLAFGALAQFARGANLYMFCLSIFTIHFLFQIVIMDLLKLLLCCSTSIVDIS